MSAVAPVAPVLQPLTLGQLLDRTFTLYRNHFALFIGIAGIPMLTIFAIMFAGGALAGLAGVATGDIAGFLLGFLVVFIAGAIAYLVAYAFALGATVHAVSEITLGRAPTVKDSLRRVRGSIGTIVGAVIMVYMAVGVGFLFFIIPGVLLLLATCLTIPAIVVEDAGASDGISRSMKLMKDGWGRAFVIFALSFFLSMVASTIFEFPFAIATGFVEATGAAALTLTFLTQIGSIIGAVLAFPISTIAFALLYFDMRVRKEAFDLQVMMAALPADGSMPPPPIPPSGLTS